MGKADLKKRKLVAETEAQEAEEVIDEHRLCYQRKFRADRLIVHGIQQM